MVQIGQNQRHTAPHSVFSERDRQQTYARTDSDFVILLITGNIGAMLQLPDPLSHTAAAY